MEWCQFQLRTEWLTQATVKRSDLLDYRVKVAFWFIIGRGNNSQVPMYVYVYVYVYIFSENLFVSILSWEGTFHSW